MADPVHGELLLACLPCRRTVVVTYQPAHVVQGLVDLDVHRTCGYCGKPMVATMRGDCAHVLLPGEDCGCMAAEQLRSIHATA